MRSQQKWQRTFERTNVSSYLDRYRSRSDGILHVGIPPARPTCESRACAPGFSIVVLPSDRGRLDAVTEPLGVELIYRLIVSD
jgi:hypothetical protein